MQVAVEMSFAQNRKCGLFSFIRREGMRREGRCLSPLCWGKGGDECGVGIGGVTWVLSGMVTICAAVARSEPVWGVDVGSV